jgi:hypothetical protein
MKRVDARRTGTTTPMKEPDRVAGGDRDEQGRRRSDVVEQCLQRIAAHRARRPTRTDSSKLPADQHDRRRDREDCRSAPSGRGR